MYTLLLSEIFFYKAMQNKCMQCYLMLHVNLKIKSLKKKQS